MIDRNFVFVRVVLRYTRCLLMMCRKLLRSSDVYVWLVEALAEVGIVVGTYTVMISSMGKLVGYSWYDIFQSSVCVGELLVRW